MRTALRGLTTRGRCLLTAGVALTVSALVLGQRDLLRAAVLLVALPLAARWVVSRTSYRLACERHLDPPRVPSGSPTTVRLRLDNVSRLPSGTLLMEDALPYTLGGRPRFVLKRVEPRGVRDISYPISPEARGRYRIGPLSVQLTDPFGLVELARAFATVDELVVTPVVVPLPSVRLGGDWSGGGEVSARSLATSGTDDATTREYRYGDDLRKVHWRSTARTGEMMVRREEQPFQSRCALLLDRRALAHRGEGPHASFEWAVSAVASIGASLTRAGYTLAVVDESGEPLTPAGAPVNENLLLGALATVQPSRARSLDDAVVRLRGVGGGLVVAVLGALDLPAAERLSALRTSAACVALLMDTDSFAPVSTRLRAEALDRHGQVGALLTSAGWRVLPVERGADLAELWADVDLSRPARLGAA